MRLCNLQYRPSPLACAIGSTVLRVLEQEDLMARVRDVGALLKRLLVALKAKHRFIGEFTGTSTDLLVKARAHTQFI